MVREMDERGDAEMGAEAVLGFGHFCKLWLFDTLMNCLGSRVSQSPSRDPQAIH